MPGVSGLELVRAVKQGHPDCEVVVISGQTGVEGVEAMNAGASTYIRKPLRVEEVRAVVEKQIDRLRIQRRRDELERRVDESYGVSGLVARSEAMRGVLTLVRQVADTNATILIL